MRKLAEYIHFSNEMLLEFVLQGEVSAAEDQLCGLRPDELHDGNLDVGAEDLQLSLGPRVLLLLSHVVKRLKALIAEDLVIEDVVEQAVLRICEWRVMDLVMLLAVAFALDCSITLTDLLAMETDRNLFS